MRKVDRFCLSKFIERSFFAKPSIKFTPNQLLVMWVIHNTLGRVYPKQLFKVVKVDDAEKAEIIAFLATMCDKSIISKVGDAYLSTPALVEHLTKISVTLQEVEEQTVSNFKTWMQ